jgi:hypothetical protein
MEKFHLNLQSFNLIAAQREFVNIIYFLGENCFYCDCRLASVLTRLVCSELLNIFRHVYLCGGSLYLSMETDKQGMLKVLE